MELMDTSLDKFYKKVLERKKTIPEDILGKIAVSVSGALAFFGGGRGDTKSRVFSYTHLQACTCGGAGRGRAPS